MVVRTTDALASLYEADETAWLDRMAELIGSKVAGFNATTGQGTLQWDRYLRSTTLSFNKIDVTLQRFTEYHNLQGAFGRRAVIEQAKGILMARHSIDAGKAFELLRDHSQHNGQKLADVAAAIVDSHLLLLPAAAAEPQNS